MAPFRLGVLTALWRRPAVAAAMLRHHVALDVPGVKVIPMAVQSPEDPEGLTAGPCSFWRGAHVVQAPNDPLSDKWNVGMAALEAFNVDAVMVVGSDDFASAAYVEAVVQLVEQGGDLVRAQECLFLDLPTGRACASRPRRLGGGRTLSRRMLDALRWRPWPSGLNVRLDGGMDRRLAKAGLTNHRDKVVRYTGDPQLLAVKSDHPDGTSANLWSYDAVARWEVEPLTPDALRATLADHFPTALDLLPVATAA